MFSSKLQFSSAIVKLFHLERFAIYGIAIASIALQTAIIHVQLPYSGLFSLGTNFPEFHECMGSLLGKIYSGLLHEVQLWVAIAEIGTDTRMHDVHMAGLLTLKPKALGCEAKFTCVHEHLDAGNRRDACL